MAWTNKQKQIAVMACKAAHISDEQRVDLILRNFQRAHYKGKVTSTSPKLTHQDFEAFMEIVESYAGGQVMHYTRGYWRENAADHLKRMRRKALAVAATLESRGLLAASGVGLAGWISKCVTRGESDRVEQLDYHGLLALITGLSAYARSHSINVEAQFTDEPNGERTLQHADA